MTFIVLNLNCQLTYQSRLFRFEWTRFWFFFGVSMENQASLHKSLADIRSYNTLTVDSTEVGFFVAIGSQLRSSDNHLQYK